jgi:16S rRNA (adenine1518-N6/adenine1519-N6)-dimethyltransferase
VSKPVIASIAYVNEILKTYDTHAKKRFGQNFIVDSNIIHKIVNTSGVDKETMVLEIGPGMGSLTQVLLEKAKKVVAIEIDPLMVELCEKHFHDEPHFTLIHDDVLNVNFEELFKSHQCLHEKCMVVANLPYYITTPILFKLIESNVCFNSMKLMVQKEVAQRFSAKVGTKDYNALSIIIQTLFEVKIALEVSRNVFIPRPAVDSSVVSLKRKKVSYTECRPYFDFLKIAFVQRRKTLYNNLKAAYPQEKIKEALIECNLNEAIRAEACTNEQLNQCFKVLSKSSSQL